ncbi:MAG: DUF1302 domain-containing protein [Limnobacter sp.]|nr:DUF1302 domain-containing protein [Limnobacter sp.]
MVFRNRVPGKLSPTTAAVSAMMAIGSALAAMPAHAYETKIGSVDLTINSTVSIGTGIRTESRDRALFSVNNVDQGGSFGTGLSNTSDDGNLNYAAGDAFSTIIKGFHDVTVKKDNYGFFGRVKWFYDYTLNNANTFHGHEPTNNNINGANQRVQQPLEDSGFNPQARFDGIDILDAYGFWNTKLGNMPADIRIGRQVISWGEGALLLNPISGLNTIDLSALRRPGVDLKEAFTPTEMLYANLGVGDNTSLEGFYQLKWRKTVLEGCGTYFSTTDIAADGCDRLAFAAPAVFAATAPTGNPVRIGDGQELNGVAAGALRPSGRFLTPIERTLDSQPDDGGQFGLALRHYAQGLDVEFGGYYLNYHSRLPLTGLQAGQTAVPAQVAGPNGQPIPAQAAGLTPGNALPYALDPSPQANKGKYFFEYPEDISVIGLSFATNIKGVAVAGQLTHAADVPVAYNANDLLAAGLSGTAGTATPNPLQRKIGAAKPGERVGGYELFDVTQIQASVFQTFNRVLGASRYLVIGEVGAVFVDGLPDIAPGQRFGRNPVFGGGAADREGFVTDFSWGYRLRAAGTYNNVIGDVDLVPSISFAHDVNGYSPEPGQLFNEGRMATGLTLTFEFDQNTSASVGYTVFANSGDFDPLRDRDFLSLSAKTSF